jgi:hypothetical protein
VAVAVQETLDTDGEIGGRFATGQGPRRVGPGQEIPPLAVFAHGRRQRVQLQRGSGALDAVEAGQQTIHARHGFAGQPAAEEALEDAETDGARP